MKKVPLFTLAAALLAVVPAARAYEISLGQAIPNLVTTGDTFNIAVVGFNTTDNSGTFLVTSITPTFNKTGAAQTFNGVARGGQVVTVTTTETLSDGNITDSISLGVPTNFIPSGTTTSTGAVINDIELDMGFSNAGINTLDFTPAVPGTPTYAGSINYNTTSTLPLSDGNGLQSTLSNNNASLSYNEVISTSTGGLSQFAIRQFNFSITYAAVPEPSTYALVGAGTLLLGAVATRRNHRRMV